MDKHFSACEIAELGVQIEKNGRDFYFAMAERTGDKEAAGIFTYLAKAEESHIDVFRSISSTACDYKPGGAYPDEYFSYMNSLADQHVFLQENKGKEAAGGVKDLKEAVEMAMRFEKDSILFFEEMKKLVPEKERGLIDRLIEEEKKHIMELTRIQLIVDSL